MRIGRFHKINNIIMYLLIKLEVFHRGIDVSHFLIKQLLLSIHRLHNCRNLPEYTGLEYRAEEEHAACQQV